MCLAGRAASMGKHHDSTARRAKYAGHAKCAEKGAQRLRASIMILYIYMIDPYHTKNPLLTDTRKQYVS